MMNRFFCFLLFFSCVILQAQYKIIGVVTDEDKIPLENAEITLQTSDSLKLVSEISDENGKFSLKDINEGNYILSIKYFSEKVYSQKITVNTDLNLQSIVLNLGRSLDEVVVKGDLSIKKKLGKYEVTNISSSPLAKNRNTLDFLSTLPILDTNPSKTEILIKNKKKAVILINGRSVGGTEIALTILKSTPAEDIKKIEIIEHPGSKYSASNDNGIINVTIQKSNDGFKGYASLGDTQSYYNSQSADANLSYSKNKWRLTTGLGMSNYNFVMKNYNLYNDYLNHIQSKIDTKRSSNTKYISPFFNLNYEINSKQNIGFQINTSFSKDITDTNSNSFYRSLPALSLDSLNQSFIRNKAPNKPPLSLNANYTLKTDSLGSNLGINFYYFNRNNDSQIYNDFYYVNQFQSILQKPEVRTKMYDFKADYTHNFKNDNVLQVGIDYTKGDLKNDFFYGNFNGTEYISDASRSNSFKYTDDYFAAYTTYQAEIGDKWETEIGLRWENYNGTGKSDMVANTKQKNSYLFPSLSLMYSVNKNHKISLDYSYSIFRPSYSSYNPNTYFTSANTYVVYNPNILPSLSHSIAVNYNFLKKFNFDVEYSFGKNSFTDFDIVQPNGLIEHRVDNYGKGDSWWLYFNYNDKFFNEYWDFNFSTGYSYDHSKGYANTNYLNFDSNSWYFKLKNYIFLNSKKNTVLNLNYGFNSPDQSILGKMNALHSLNFELSKSYKNWNFSFGTYDILESNVKLKENREDYSFHKTRKAYQTFYLNLSYLFGNRKVKSVSGKQSDASNRLN